MDTRIIPQDFYVYLHRKATTGEVFYVGKGHGNRAWALKSRTAAWRSTAAKHAYIVEIVQEGLQEWAAFEAEVGLVALYGRRDLGLGPLVNMTDGGDGVAGFRATPSQVAANRERGATRLSTPEAKAAHSVQMRKVWADAQRRRRQALTTKAHVAKHPRPCAITSEETRAKQSSSAKAKWADPGKSAALRQSISKAASKAVVCNGVILFSSQTAAAVWVVSRRVGGAPSLHTAVRNIQGAVQRRDKGRNSTAYGYSWSSSEGAFQQRENPVKLRA